MHLESRRLVLAAVGLGLITVGAPRRSEAGLDVTFSFTGTVSPTTGGPAPISGSFTDNTDQPLYQSDTYDAIYAASTDHPLTAMFTYQGVTTHFSATAYTMDDGYFNEVEVFHHAGVEDSFLFSIGGLDISFVNGGTIFTSTALPTALPLSASNKAAMQYDNGISFIQATFTSLASTAVPEPSSLVLTGLAGALGAIRERRRLLGLIRWP